MEKWVTDKVHIYYWEDDVNCATTMLKILTELADMEIHQDVIKAAIGLHGAGGYGAQCGLVEGALIFIGLAGSRLGLPQEQVVSICRQYAQGFSSSFKSLVCREIRPQGFGPDNPPHLCEKITVAAVLFAIRFLQDRGLIPTNDLL